MRVFAAFAAFVMVSVAFGVVVQSARADVAGPGVSTSTTGSTATTYGPGVSATGVPGGTQVSYYSNFRRSDGVWLPTRALNFSAGNWPYVVSESASTFTVSLGGLSFTQGKLPGATYSYDPDRIKETIAVNSSFPMPVTVPSIFVPFSTSYVPIASGNSVSLYGYSRVPVWTTQNFSASDSAMPSGRWANAVASIQFVSGGLELILNTTMTSAAVYPLYIDPTWVLNNGNNWGGGTLSNLATDVGDGNLKIGLFADDFNNNQAGPWSTTGSVSFSGGTMNLGNGGTSYYSSTWTMYSAQFDVNFSSHSSGTDRFDFYVQASSSHTYGGYLDVLQSSGLVTLYGFGGAACGQFAASIATGTWYTVRFDLGLGSSVDVYWNGVHKLSISPAQTCLASPYTGLFFGATTPSSVSIDNFRMWDPNNPSSGTITTPKRNALGNRPVTVETFGSVDLFNQTHVQIRSSPDNVTWGPWTLLKANAASGIPYSAPNQTQQQYYQVQVVLTNPATGTPSLSQITILEGTPSVSPTANTGVQPWYPYAGGTINLVTGNLYVAASDLSFQGRGFTLGVTRSYNSLLASTAGPFGLGWTFNYGQTLAINSNGNVTWNGPDGSAFLFVAKGTTPAFDSPRGVPDRLAKNADGTFTLWMTDGGTEHFSSAGLLMNISDKNGNALTLTYTGSPLVLSTVKDGAGRTLSFSYDKSHRIASVTDLMQRKVTYAYASKANVLQSVTDPMGNATKYAYNSGNILTQVRDPVGKQLQVSYVAGGQVSSLYLQNVTSSGSVVWQYPEYVVAYNTTTMHSVKDARGYWTTVYLNGFGNPIVVTGPSLGCAACTSQGNTSSYVWDGEMNKISTTDGRHNTWTMTYGFRGNLLSTTDPGGNVSSTTWLEVNSATNYFVLPWTTTTARGYTTTMNYDGKGNLLWIADPGGNITQYAYDSSGFMNRTVSPLGYTTWFVYNASGYLVKREDNLSEATTYAYDILGRQTSVTDPMGLISTTTYDKDSRVTRTTDPLGNFTTYAYSARGDLLSVTDPDGATTAYGYNVTNGKVQTTTDSGGNASSSVYDLRANLASTTDADHDTTTCAYDAYDRLVQVTTPLGYATKYVYDRAGNRIARTDGNGYTTRYAYDKNERLAATIYPGPPVYGSPQTLTYTYDADGDMVQATGFGYTETIGYDHSDRLSSSVFNYGTYSVTTSFTYDRDWNRATMTLGTSTTMYYYDKVGRLTGILDPEGQNTTFRYDKDSRQTSEKNPSGVTTTSLYDKASRLKAMYTNTSSGSVLESFTYVYDKAGLRTSETDVQNGVSTTTSYAYDKVHRLYETSQGSVTTTDTYDAVGNVLSENTETYSYDADNQLNYVYWSGVLRISYQYDKDGNRLSSYVVGRGGGDTYTYDYENRIRSSSGGCSYTYAPTGERVTSTCSTTTTDLAYDPSSGGNVLATYTSSGAQTARYLDSGGLNSPVEVYEGGNHYAYQTDALGSVRMLTGGSQNATDTYAYDPWGNPTSQSGTLANPFEYTGSIYAPDVNSNGYYDDRARFYDPSADGGHRFLSQDPVGSGYTYVGDGPLNFVDPTGRMYTHLGGGGGCSGQCTLVGQTCSSCSCSSVSSSAIPIPPPTRGRSGSWSGIPTIPALNGFNWGCVLNCMISQRGLASIAANPFAIFVCGSVCPSCFSLLSTLSQIEDPIAWLDLTDIALIAETCGACAACVANFSSCVQGCRTG